MDTAYDPRRDLDSRTGDHVQLYLRPQAFHRLQEVQAALAVEVAANEQNSNGAVTGVFRPEQVHVDPRMDDRDLVLGDSVIGHKRVGGPLAPADKRGGASEDRLVQSQLDGFDRPPVPGVSIRKPLRIEVSRSR